uniref:Uncharacterized protein n=1 Tax=Oryza sativa subsp. japonica TaxID=39947 RepID=Q69K45_ORYSJ|nr:hypothetical protein [Oryza sativa Japonica Group]BAD36656.1 hypothetical protein [Oryza sativa Japonica Group]
MVVAEFREDAGNHVKQERGTNRTNQRPRNRRRTRANSKQASGVLLTCARRGAGVRHAQLRAMPPSSPCRSLSVLMLQYNPTLGDIPSGFLLGRPASSCPVRGRPTRSSSREDGRRDPPRARTAGELLPARGLPARSSTRADGRRLGGAASSSRPPLR